MILFANSHTLKTHVKDTQGLVTGAGTILQVALQGGVFCWLQRMDSKYFNRLVQVRANATYIHKYTNKLFTNCTYGIL